jgi:hypothetical protein
MEWLHVFWDLEPGGNAEHGLDLEDVEHVLKAPERHGTSRTSGYPLVFGHTRSGEYIVVVYEEIDDDTVCPVTAFVIEE